MRSITDLMVMPGLINLDFADIRSVMNEMGKAMMGTGEGEGDNRALEAAERAIANPLLDGVSMQGAKGVIISIIGGEDMKLLEVDEAANHIRELVDPEANIIWGSAFNPDLDGKIRVSVVATGIEQNAEQVQTAPRPLNLGGMRGPKKPALPPIEEEAVAEETPEVEEVAEEAADDSEDALDLMGSEVLEEDGEDAADNGAEELLAEEDAAAEAADEQPAEEDPFARPAGTDFAPPDDNGEPGKAGAEVRYEGMFELTEEAPAAEDEAEEDELLLDASRLAEADEPVKSAEELPPPAPAGGSTLFERMASLSRSGSDAEEDEEEEEEESSGSAMRIPRFLGRQNNQ